MGDAAVPGGVFGATVTHAISASSAITASAHAAFLKHDIRTYAARVGIRTHHVELGLRVLDFNVGPALFGPELGFAF